MYETPGRHPEVVLQNEILAFRYTHHVDAGDMRVDAAGHLHALHFAPILRVAEHPFRGHYARLQDALFVIDIVQEEVERIDALLQTLLEQPPFRRVNDARDDVEGNQAFGAGIFPVNREGDADAMEGALGFLAFLGDLFGRRPVQPVGKSLVMGADRAVARSHLIVMEAGHGRRMLRLEVF